MAARGVDKTPAEVDQALTVLAYYGGNAVRAAQEIGMSDRTLRLWKASTHRDRYLEIAEREGPRLEAIAAQQSRELILRAGETEHTLLDLLNTRIEDAQTPIPHRVNFEDEGDWQQALKEWEHRASSKELGELAGTLQRVTTAKGINGTKLLELTGRPTSIVEHRDPRAEGLALLKRYGITVESTAEELPASPLLPQSAESNARDRSVSSPAD